MSFHYLWELLLANTSDRHTVVRNWFWRALAVGLSKGARLIVVFLAARWLGPTVFGEYNYVFALIAIAFIFSDWGINVLMIRNVQQRPEDASVFAVAFITKLLISLLSAVAAIALVFVVEPALMHLAALLIMLMVLGNIRDIYINAMIARQRGELEAITAVVEGAVSLALAWYMLQVYPTSATFALLNLLAMLSALIISLYIVRRRLGFVLQSVSWKQIRDLLLNGLPLAFFGLIGYIFFSSDQLFIQYYLGAAAVGYYALVARIIQTAQLIPSLLVSVVFPIVAKAVADHARLRFLFVRGTVALAVLGGACALLIIALQGVLVSVLPEYAPAMPVLVTLSVILVAMFPSVWLDYVLIALDRQKQNFYFTVGVAILNLVLNFMLIPYFGILGAAYATMISQATNVAVTYAYASRVIRRLSA